MKYDINFIRRLFEEKALAVSSEEDEEKIDNLKTILQNDNVFFMIDAETAVGILAFLGIREERIKEVYLSLISPETFKETDDTYITIGEK